MFLSTTKLWGTFAGRLPLRRESGNGAFMLTFFRIGLDDEATGLLLDLAQVTGQTPRELLARLVRDILIEDAEAHGYVSGRPVTVSGGPSIH